METLRKIFSSKINYLLLFEFIVLVALTIKYYIFNELNVDDGKPFFNFMLTLLSITGGCIGIKRMNDWGGYKSQVGKIPLFLSFGFFAWAAGTIIWSYYYLFLDNAIPYPSWADLAYILINPSWIIGIGLLGYITAVRNPLHVKEKIYFFFIPVCMAIVTYYFIYMLGYGGVNTEETLLKVILDFYYSGGDIVQLVILMLVSGSTFNYLGERLKLPFIIIVSIIPISYIADILYGYTTSIGIYVNGDITDFLFSCVIFLLSLGVSNLHPKLLEDKE